MRWRGRPLLDCTHNSIDATLMGNPLTLLLRYWLKLRSWASHFLVRLSYERSTCVPFSSMLWTSHKRDSYLGLVGVNRLLLYLLHLFHSTMPSLQSQSSK